VRERAAAAVPKLREEGMGRGGSGPAHVKRKRGGGLAGRHGTCGGSNQRMSHNAGENKGSGLVGRYGSAGVGLARRIVSLFIYSNYFKKT
jgi:hypothetical protein